MIQSLSIQSMLETIDVRTGAERRKALLGVRGLRKRFDGRLLFDIGCLDIATHGAYALTGANGAGKSTLLRVLGGFEPAEVDSLRFEGLDVALQPYPRALRRAVVYVHQHPILFSTSVAHNVGYGLQVRGVKGEALARGVEDAMEWAGVSHLRDSDPARLSDGERQRVALARAWVLRPKLLLLDEPMTSLDDVGRERVRAWIAGLAGKGYSAMVACSEHELAGLPGVQRLELRDGKLG